jgi:hypothetical protein
MEAGINLRAKLTANSAQDSGLGPGQALVPGTEMT